MKRALIVPILFLVCTGLAYSQLSATANVRPSLYVGTESTQNLPKNVTGTAGVDTTADVTFLVGIMFNTPVANDTITVADCDTTIASFSWATAPAIFYAPFNCKITDSLFVTRAATSDLTLIYRVSY